MARAGAWAWKDSLFGLVEVFEEYCRYSPNAGADQGRSDFPISDPERCAAALRLQPPCHSHGALSPSVMRRAFFEFELTVFLELSSEDTSEVSENFRS